MTRIQGPPDVNSSQLYNSIVYLDFFTGEAIQGSWMWSVDASLVGGGYFGNSSANINDEYNWTGVKLQEGSYKISVLALKASSRGIATMTFAGETIAEADLYNATNVDNALLSDTFTLSSDTSGVIELKALSKNGSSTNYLLSISMLKIERTA